MLTSVISIPKSFVESAQPAETKLTTNKTATRAIKNPKVVFAFISKCKNLVKNKSYFSFISFSIL
jgi:hypothetical protein